MKLHEPTVMEPRWVFAGCGVGFIGERGFCKHGVFCQHDHKDGTKAFGRGQRWIEAGGGHADVPRVDLA